MTLNTNQKPNSYDLGHPAFERSSRPKNWVKRRRTICAAGPNSSTGFWPCAGIVSRGSWYPIRTCLYHVQAVSAAKGERRIETANYIAAADVERILPEMVEVAGLLEAVLS